MDNTNRINHAIGAGGVAIIEQIGGLAGQALQMHQQGKQLSAQEKAMAMEAQRIQALLANQNTPAAGGLGAGGITSIVLLVGVFGLIVFLLYKFK